MSRVSNLEKMSYTLRKSSPSSDSKHVVSSSKSMPCLNRDWVIYYTMNDQIYIHTLISSTETRDLLVNRLLLGREGIVGVMPKDQTCSSGASTVYNHIICMSFVTRCIAISFSLFPAANPTIEILAKVRVRVYFLRWKLRSNRTDCIVPSSKWNTMPSSNSPQPSCFKR